MRISSGGHPLALVRRADGRVQAASRPGTLLGFLAHPELHDSRVLLRAGDSLVLFTDGELTYCETSLVSSYTQALSHLNKVGKFPSQPSPSPVRQP